MSGALKRTMSYLGLNNDLYEDDEYYDDEQPYAESSREDVRVERVEREEVEEREQPRAQVTPLQRVPAGKLVHQPSMGPITRITPIQPRQYNDAREVADAYRQNIPVIMNLSDMNEAEARRLVDFGAGLTYGLGGSITRVTPKVFLLTPASVEVVGGEDDNRAGHSPFNQS